MDIVIIGAGVAGSISFEYFRNFKPTIFDSDIKKNTALKNHEAIIRIKNKKLGDILGCSLKEIEVTKEIYSEGKIYKRSNSRLNNLYSYKTNKAFMNRSISGTKDQNQKRYLLPANFTVEPFVGWELVGIKKKYLIFIDTISGTEQHVSYDVCISTIPLPTLLKIIGYKHNMYFGYENIFIKKIKYSLKAKGIYQTIYFPDLYLDTYRATLEENCLTVESMNELTGDEITIIESAFGLDCLSTESEVFLNHKQKFGKIQPVEYDYERKAALLYLTKEYNIYSLGRFATWRQVMVDDLVGDLEKIKSMIYTNKAITEYDLKLKEEL